jgi:hypothetical protein
MVEIGNPKLAVTKFAACDNSSARSPLFFRSPPAPAINSNPKNGVGVMTREEMREIRAKIRRRGTKLIFGGRSATMALDQLGTGLLWYARRSQPAREHQMAVMTAAQL